jgi:hypothetical protein
MILQNRELKPFPLRPMMTTIYEWLNWEFITCPHSTLWFNSYDWWCDKGSVTLSHGFGGMFGLNLTQAFGFQGK